MMYEIPHDEKRLFRRDLINMRLHAYYREHAYVILFDVKSWVRYQERARYGYQLKAYA